MDTILHNIWSGLSTASLLDQLNLVLGIAGVYLMVRRSLWAFPVGLVAVSVQALLFYRSHFPADALLQVFYFVTLAWGWWHWGRDRGEAAELPIIQLSPRGRVLTLSAATAATVVWALTIGPAMHAVMPWRDAFIACFSVAAQVLQVRKNIENWAIWAVVNLVAIASYWSADLAYTAFLYAIYLVLGLLGWRTWWRAMRVRRVAIFGPESTGKTMLAEKLAAHFGAPNVPEYARQFWDEHGAITREDIPGIALRQGESEDGAAKQAKQVIFCDTESLTTVLWSDLLYKECPPEVRFAAERRARRYDLYLLMNTDVPFAPDPQRVFPDEPGRTRCMTLWREALVFRNLPFVEIRGNWTDRERTAIAAVEKLLRG